MRKTPLLAALSFAILGLTGCPEPREPLEVHRLPKYNENPNAVIFGEWLVHGCELVSSHQQLQLTTDGDIDNDQLRFEIHSTVALQSVPQIALNTITVPISAEGRRHRFSFEVPYTVNIARQLMNDYTFFFIYYTPRGSGLRHEGYFQTQGLAEGLAYLERTCNTNAPTDYSSY